MTSLKPMASDALDGMKLEHAAKRVADAMANQ
jgi:hypothetical protein